MFPQTSQQAASVKSLLNDFIQKQKRVSHLAVEEISGQAEIVIIIQDIQVFNDFGIGQFLPAETDDLVKDGKCITHCPVRFLGYDIQSLLLGNNAFL